MGDSEILNHAKTLRNHALEKNVKRISWIDGTKIVVAPTEPNSRANFIEMTSKIMVLIVGEVE